MYTIVEADNLEMHTLVLYWKPAAVHYLINRRPRSVCNDRTCEPGSVYYCMTWIIRSV